MNTLPLSPDQILKSKIDRIHPSMIKVINELLHEWNGSGSITIFESEIIDKFLELEPDYNRSDVISNGWMDFEHLYRLIGWDVEYESPSYREEFREHYIFKKKKIKYENYRKTVNNFI